MSTSAELAPPPDASALDRPFDPGVLGRAATLAARYRVVMWFEDGTYFAQGVELPGAGGDGLTPDVCMASAREAFTACLATMIEAGDPVPMPVTEVEAGTFAESA